MTKLRCKKLLMDGGQQPNRPSAGSDSKAWAAHGPPFLRGPAGKGQAARNVVAHFRLEAQNAPGYATTSRGRKILPRHAAPFRPGAIMVAAMSPKQRTEIGHITWI
jgi:hypothetical protein